MLTYRHIQQALSACLHCAGACKFNNVSAVRCVDGVVVHFIGVLMIFKVGVTPGWRTVWDSA